MDGELKTFIINLVCRTKPGDYYDQVALNKFPIVVIDNDIESVIKSEINDYINKLVPNEVLRDDIKLYIRILDDNNVEEKQIIELAEYIKK